MRDISKLVKQEQESANKPKTTQEIFDSIIRADMELMLKEAKHRRPREFPDPVEPQWKN